MTEFRSGFVTLVGRPNVGKSTLINALVGKKISITSRKPQTTRHRILGIVTNSDSQVVFVDTPGVHRRHRRAMNRIINRTARNALAGVDLVLLMITGKGWQDDDQLALSYAANAGRPVILVINKVDLVKPKDRLLPLIAKSQERLEFAEIVPVSATRRDNTDALMAAVVRHLPRAPACFPADQLTDRGDRFVATELVREQLFRILGQELPYTTAVRIEDYDDTPDITHIDAQIWVDRENQKSIVIGKGGERLKTIGTRAREQIEAYLDKRVNLKLWVKVRAGWVDNQAALHSLGYIEE